MKKLLLQGLLSGFILLLAFAAGAQTIQSNSNGQSRANLQKHVAMQQLSPAPTVVQGADAPPAFPKFLSYPTSHVKPRHINTGNIGTDKRLHELRLQHWYFLNDQATYQVKYGALPTNLPGGVSPQQYASNPPDHSFSADLERYFQTGDLNFYQNR